MSEEIEKRVRPPMQPSVTTIEMPRYVSHKTVQALEIDYCVRVDAGRRIVNFKDAGFEAIMCEREMFARYQPINGDFYVVYADGYKSFSPRKAFLEGYTRAP